VDVVRGLAQYCARFGLWVKIEELKSCRPEPKRHHLDPLMNGGKTKPTINLTIHPLPTFPHPCPTH
jgi:hypothetical protein